MNKNWITDIYYTMMGVYRIPEHMGVRFRDEDMFVKNVLAREEVLYVEHPAEEEIYKQIDRDRLLVVRGPKGDGLSMAALAALVRKMLIDRVVVVNPIIARDCLGDATELQEVVDSIREMGREPIFYLDISTPRHYPQKPWGHIKYSPVKLKKFIDALKDVEFISKDEDVTTVVVISNDLYEILNLKEHATVEVNSSDVYFLRELVQTYSNCGEDAAKEIAEAVAKYDCGRSVLATLVADWLSKQNCQRTVTEALKVAEEKAKKFFIDYVWHTVLNRDRRTANLHAPLILLRYFEGSVSVESAEDFLISLGFPDYKVRWSEAVKWIATQHCRLVDDAIKEVVEAALSKKIEEELYQALRYAAINYRNRFKSKGYFK